MARSAQRDLAGRTDFRPLVTVTIDGEHARDFDDAITIERLANGNYWLGVHIADVAHYVPEGGALDEEAYERATSVYFPDRAVHMFPSDLSTGLCSLNPNVDRLVQSCLMEVDRKGAVVRYEIHDGVIHSNARMTYTDVNAILTDHDAAVSARYRELVPQFELMKELFEILNRRRHRRGSIDFDLKEPEIVLDDQGLVEAIIAAERNIAHRLIEEFMLLANETVAAHLDDHDVPTLYRIHEEPDPLKVEEFEEFISTLGYSLGKVSSKVTPARLPEAGRADARHARREADRLPHAADDAEGALRPGQSRPLRPRGRQLHALHVAHPAVSRPGRAPHAAGIPPRRHERGARGRADRGAARGRAPHLRARAPRRRRRAGTGAVEEGPLHGGQGRRRVRWLRHRASRHSVSTSSSSSTSSRAWCTCRRWPTTTIASSTARTCCAVRTKGKVYRLGDRVKVQVVKVDMERRQVDLGLVEILDAVRASEENRGPRRSKAQPRQDRGKPARAAKGKQRPGKKERAARKRR